MVDLADFARKHYFYPVTKGSSFIKKVLPAVMRSSEFLKATYSQPTYGVSEGFASRNFESVAWWQLGALDVVWSMSVPYWIGKRCASLLNPPFSIMKISPLYTKDICV